MEEYIMYCVSCGALMPDGAKFCQKCGKPLPQNPAQGIQNPQPQILNPQISSQAAPGYVQQPQAPNPQPQASPYVQQPQGAAYRNQPPTANAAAAGKKAAAKTAKKAAAKAGKAGMGLGAKIAVGAAVGGLAIAAVNGVLGDGGGGDGGGTYKPPVVQQETNNGSGYNGSYGTTETAASGEYYIWESYSPDGNNIEAMLVRIGPDGVVNYVYRDGEEEEMFTMNGSPSSSSMSLNVSEEDGTGSISVSKNADGSFSGMMSSNTDEGHARTYTKLVPVTHAGGENWTIPSTGETLSYDQIYYESLDGTTVGSQFLRESSSAGNVFVEYDNKSDNTPTYQPVYSTPKPSSGNNAVTIPDDVMQTYVTYELENIEHEFNGVKVPNHIKMPNETEQQRFEALIENELFGDRLYFWYDNKDDWYK